MQFSCHKPLGEQTASRICTSSVWLCYCVWFIRLILEEHYSMQEFAKKIVCLKIKQLNTVLCFKCHLGLMCFIWRNISLWLDNRYSVVAFCSYFSLWYLKKINGTDVFKRSVWFWPPLWLWHSKIILGQSRELFDTKSKQRSELSLMSVLWKQEVKNGNMVV